MSTPHIASAPTSAADALDHTPNHDLGLAADVRTLMARRGLLRLAGGLGLVAVAGCAAETSTGGATSASGSASSSASSPAATGTDSTDATGTVVPDETGGPYPGDGSNGVNVLDDSGIVRSDIRSSVGTSSTVAQGVPLTINLTVTDSSQGYAGLAGAAVYVWHCDRDGNYSMYSQGVEQENYLRGVQETDAEGSVSFTSIFPACYAGRWPHIHFEVYSSVEDATSSGPIIKTSQIALPEAVCATVFAEEGYDRSVQNLTQVSLTSDNVFGDDGGIHQLATVTGSVAKGYTANLTVGV
ncbi:MULTISPECIES: intradiol ring-cleavage dioxygenase [unclassified Janibacter]|uniref:intradiol ring-cleavage dioxygenase n=1 Tax=unclassified Janibacter TaxID=2649294 RepID=UPI003CFFE6F5